MLTGYSKRLEKDVERWVASGLIDRATANALLADAQANDRRSVSFGFILMMMAALLLCAAILLIVASNWEAIPRLARVAMLFAVIGVGYIGGALLKLRGHTTAAEGAWLIAAAGFGGGIALIGQMYHMSGDENAAILTWCVGTTLAAAALLSAPLTVAAAGISTAWFLIKWSDYSTWDGLPHGYPVLAAVIWLVSLWTGSTAARSSLGAVPDRLCGDAGRRQCAVGFAASHDRIGGVVRPIGYGPRASRAIGRLDGRLPLHALIGFLVGALILQFENTENTSTPRHCRHRCLRGNCGGADAGGAYEPWAYAGSPISVSPAN